MTKERRNRGRIRFQAPATVTIGQHSIAASTKDISDRGLFFFTDTRVELGSEIDIVITLPEEVGLPLSGMVCCHGRVVRSDSGGGQCGVAVQIDRFASVPLWTIPRTPEHPCATQRQRRHSRLRWTELR